VRPAEIALSEQRIVRAAEEPEVLDRASAAEREGVLVMELEACAFAAAPATRIGERALGRIALPDGAPDGGRYMAPSCRASPQPLRCGFVG